MVFFGLIFLLPVFLHALMLSLFVEAAIGRIGRAWLIIPICFYGSYYAVCYYQTILIERKSAELRASNLGHVMDFDPNRYSLVTEDAFRLVSGFKIPVAFMTDHGVKEGYSSFRLLPKDQCKIPLGRFPAVALGLSSYEAMYKAACVLRMPEAIQKQILRFETRGDQDWQHRWGFNERVTEVFGGVSGSFRTASFWRWSAFPSGAFACYFSGYPRSLKCDGEVFGELVYIDGFSNETDPSKMVIPASVMLSLPKYTQADTQNFLGSDREFDFAEKMQRSK